MDLWLEVFAKQASSPGFDSQNSNQKPDAKAHICDLNILQSYERERWKNNPEAMVLLI